MEKPNLIKRLFTTGQAAKIFTVAPRTLSKWFDSGRLKGHRIPGSQDRRITRLSILRMLADEGMGVSPLETVGDPYRVLYVGENASFGEKLCERGNFAVTTVEQTRDAEQVALEAFPMCVVIDWSLPDAAKVVHDINAEGPYKGLAVMLGLITSTNQRQGNGLDTLTCAYETEHENAIDYEKLAKLIEREVLKKYFRGE